jgi:catechol 2,3-dioxygenase-like lactoylglutathione lyase family enzyme
MQNILGQITLLVDEYDKAITYYTELLEFELLEDTSITENILGLASVAWLLRLFL